MKKKQPVALIILDGFGYSTETKYNAIYNANTPNFDHWFKTYPHAILKAAGAAVGLYEGVIGNSEVGHMTIGSGRMTSQPDLIMHKAIDDGSFFTNSVLVNNLKKIAKNNTLHIFGLLSDAGVHAHQRQIHAFIQAGVNLGITTIVVHPFLDGRDTPPQSAKHYLQQLDNVLQKLGCGIIGSIHGRLYAMDRDHNWERTEQSYRTLTEQQNISFKSWREALDYYYSKGITDEFIPPTQLNTKGFVQNGDGIIFANFRPDRARQLTASFINHNFNYFTTKKIDLSCFITPTKYSNELKTAVMFESPIINNTLKEVLDSNGKTIFSIAETEKYAHVTYFFNGGKEEKLSHETRMVVPSLSAESYIDHPEMSAAKITSVVLQSLKENPKDFYLINYANADMVGHSGNFDATVKAIEFLDEQLKHLFDQVVSTMNGTLFITADHGNAEDMFDKEIGQPRTAHTNNPVPFIMIKQDLKDSHLLPLTQLADIAPFILQQMGIAIPKQMKR